MIYSIELVGILLLFVLAFAVPMAVIMWFIIYEIGSDRQIYGVDENGNIMTPLFLDQQREFKKFMKSLNLPER